MFAKYTLAAMVVAGNGIPASKRLLGASKFSIRVSIGGTVAETTSCANVKGEVHWNEMLRVDNISLPNEPASIPDVFVHLIKGGNPICFARVKV